MLVVSRFEAKNLTHFFDLLSPALPTESLIISASADSHFQRFMTTTLFHSP